jgi:hypothetical protein
MTFWRTGWAKPGTTNLLPTVGATVSNLVVVPIGADGRIAICGTATTHLAVDVVGYTVAN